MTCRDFDGLTGEQTPFGHVEWVHVDGIDRRAGANRGPVEKVGVHRDHQPTRMQQQFIRREVLALSAGAAGSELGCDFRRHNVQPSTVRRLWRRYRLLPQFDDLPDCRAPDLAEADLGVAADEFEQDVRRWLGLHVLPHDFG